MAQAAAQQPAAPAAAPRPVAIHKSTAIIPGWSRPLSSQSLTIECQKISQPSRSASAKESYGVMELEVMKFVAYCGGLTIKLRLDDLQFGHVDRSAALPDCPATVQHPLRWWCVGTFTCCCSALALAAKV